MDEIKVTSCPIMERDGGIRMRMEHIPTGMIVSGSGYNIEVLRSRLYRRMEDAVKYFERK